MLTMFKVFGIKLKCEYYRRLVTHYINEADGFVKNGKYDDACKCWVNIRKYVEKQAALWSELLEMA